MSRVSDVKNASEATAIAKEAVRVASQLAEKTDATTNRLTDTMAKLSETIIKLTTGLEYISKDVGDIKKKLEDKYVSDEVFDPVKRCSSDHEKRIRKLEYYLAVGIGVLLTLQIVLKFFIK